MCLVGLIEDGVCRSITKEGIENVEYIHFRRSGNGWEREGEGEREGGFGYIFEEKMKTVFKKLEI